MTQIISIKETSVNSWRITFDGKVLGDSRGYIKEKAIKEAHRLVAMEYGEFQGAKWVWIARELSETI